VKNYLCVLNTGENRNTFSPQDLSRVIVANADSSNIAFLPFPGKHSSCAQNNDPRAKEISDIAWTLAADFMENFGTQFKPPPPRCQSWEMFARYCVLTARAQKYAKIKQKGLKQRLIGLGLGRRTMTEDLGSYTSFSDYFINEHHRRLFHRKLPALYRWVFTRDGASAGLMSRKISSTHPIAQEIEQVKGYALPSLALLGVTTEDGLVKLPAPGSGIDNKPVASGQINANLAIMGVIT
jgi:hypothetical protein